MYIEELQPFGEKGYNRISEKLKVNSEKFRVKS